MQNYFSADLLMCECVSSTHRASVYVSHVCECIDCAAWS